METTTLAHRNPPSIPETIDADTEPKYGGYSRFEIECEFVSSLANPRYLQHLAANKFFDDPRFVEYLRYLQYWREPAYVKYLVYPGPTLNHLRLLQEERFRKEIISPETVMRLELETLRATHEWAKPSD